MSITELVRAYYTARISCEEAKKLLKELTEIEEQAKLELLAGMVEMGVPSIDIEGLGKFSMSTINHLSVTAANKPSFYKYLKESGNAGLLKEDVNPRTLSAFLKEHLIEIENKNIAAGMDVVTARQSALEFLNSKGASYFSEKNISFRRS